ncbi:mitofusin [Cryptococcus deuterogattii 2001/935-1]|nr:mitofusin [Cryptococcus deuterogattii 2001/935-1]
MQPFYPHTPQTTRHLYAPSTPDSPSFEKESHFSSFSSEEHARQKREAADGVVRDYEEKRDRLAKAIESSVYLLADLKNFNGQQWTVRYPHLRSSESVQSGSSSPRPGMSRRTLTFADEPSQLTEVVLSSTPTARHSLKRSLSVAPALAPSPSPSDDSATLVAEPASIDQSEDDFSILRLDLNMGATRHAKHLISHLEKSSISALLDNRITASLDHLTNLQKRIYDAHSRVLVTGDLNAGKSTLINTLLRREEVMPTDQQPLTTRFVEVVSAKENENKEEIHVLDKANQYNPLDKSTYSVLDISKLEELVTDPDSDASSPPLRVFLREADTDVANPSILHNGVVDISLIDAPGLNRDSIKTTANFARQEEIDVVVFVVSAANHFTLSAKEFIWQAGHEKAHLFIVVNRFDQIKDKARCRRLVLEQIKQLSPKTYEDADSLVHFVDSAKAAIGYAEGEGDELDDAFSHLEHSLRSFVLVNRSKSKLGPAQNYVTHLLADVELLAAANSLVASKERDIARDELARVKPVLEKMKKGREGLEDGLVHEEEDVTEQVAERTKKGMTTALMSNALTVDSTLRPCSLPDLVLAVNLAFHQLAWGLLPSHTSKRSTWQISLTFNTTYSSPDLLFLPLPLHHLTHPLISSLFQQKASVLLPSPSALSQWLAAKLSVFVLPLKVSHTSLTLFPTLLLVDGSVLFWVSSPQVPLPMSSMIFPTLSLATLVVTSNQPSSHHRVTPLQTIRRLPSLMLRRLGSARKCARSCVLLHGISASVSELR